MIIVINSQGKVVSQQNDDIFQGSVKANVIDLVAPFAENVDFYATFELPDGRLLPEKLKYGYLMNRSVKVIDGLNVWKLLVNFPITQLHGIVTIQLKGVIGNQIVCTSSIKVNVQKGIPYINEEEDLEPSQYDILSSMIQELRGLLNNKVDTEHLKFELAEVNEDTVGYYYIFDENGKAINVVLPEQYDEKEQYYTADKIGRIANNDNGVYIEYLDGEKKVKIELKNDKVLINSEKVIVEKDLIAENIKYDKSYSKLNSETVQKAIDELKYNMNDLGNSQVIDIGTHTLSASNWVAGGEYYEYRFRDKLFTDALIQGLIVTPNAKAINDLNDNDILIYPEIDIEQESEGVAVAIIKADKRPTFNIVANIKIQGTTVNANIEGIKANQILFTPSGDLTSETVQKAIEEVQDNLEEFEDVYSEDKTKYVKLDENGKVPASQLPAYVDDVIECYLHNGAMYLTRTGTDDNYVYENAVIPVSGKIYVDLQTNKQYRWSGSQYTIISESLALGETSSTAYSGAKGKQNAEDIKNIKSILNGLNIEGGAVLNSVYSQYSNGFVFKQAIGGKVTETGLYFINTSQYTLTFLILDLDETLYSKDSDNIIYDGVTHSFKSGSDTFAYNVYYMPYWYQGE